MHCHESGDLAQSSSKSALSSSYNMCTITEPAPMRISEEYKYVVFVPPIFGVAGSVVPVLLHRVNCVSPKQPQRKEEANAFLPVAQKPPQATVPLISANSVPYL